MMAYFDWTKKDVERVIQSGRNINSPVVKIDTRVTKESNKIELVQWIKELGHKPTDAFKGILVELDKGGEI